jgi:hypothetical protein
VLTIEVKVTNFVENKSKFLRLYYSTDKPKFNVVHLVLIGRINLVDLAGSENNKVISTVSAWH